MLSSIRWLANLVSTQRETVAYELEAKLDLGQFQPMVRVRKKGEINLSVDGADKP